MKVQVLIIPAAGGSEYKLADLETPLYMEATGLSWSPDGKWLAVPTAKDGKDGLFLLSTETGALRRLTTASHKRADLDPSFSPDGRYIAFRCRNLESKSEICLLALSKDYEPVGSPEVLTRAGVRSTGPVWTADGNSIVFSSGPFDSDCSMYRLRVFPAPMRSDSLEQLSGAGEFQFSLAVSRKGDMLAYTRQVSDINIWSVKRAADGRHWQVSEPAPLLSSNGIDKEPDFSPDGRFVAFVSTRLGHRDIWIGGLDGSPPRKLTSFTGELTTFPKWSPDGRRIAFSVMGSGTCYVINAAGGVPQKLIDHGSVSSWSRDGNWIYYTTREGNQEPRIFKTSAGGGPAVQVISQTSWNAQESVDGRLLYFQNAEGIWRYSLPNGPAKLVVELPRVHSYSITTDGILAMATSPTHGSSVLTFHSFADGSVTEVASTTHRTSPGLAVSPDGNVVLFSQTDEQHMNLMLVRGSW